MRHGQERSEFWVRKPVNECAIDTSNEWKKVFWWLWCEERIGSWAERRWEGRQNLD